MTTCCWLLQVQAVAKLDAGSVAFAAGVEDFYSRAKDRLEKLSAHISEAEASFRCGSLPHTVYVTWLHLVCSCIFHQMTNA